MKKFIGLLVISFLAGIVTTNYALAQKVCTNSVANNGVGCGLTLPCVRYYPDDKEWPANNQPEPTPSCTVNGNSVACNLYPSQVEGVGCDALTATCANGIKQETVPPKNSYLGTLYSCN